MRKTLLYSLFLLLLLTACQADKPTQIEGVIPEIEIVKSDGRLANEIEFVKVNEPIIALTFNGLAEKETMDKLLEQLARHHIKATFFFEGMRIAQEPELVQKVMDQGHEVQNGTLSFLDMTTLDYEETYEEIYLANKVFEERLNYKPAFVRSRSGDITENMRLASAALNMEAVVGSSINPRDRDMQSAEEIAEYIKRFLHDGAVIHLNTYINPAIIEVMPLLATIADDEGYSFVVLKELIENMP